MCVCVCYRHVQKALGELMELSIMESVKPVVAMATPPDVMTSLDTVWYVVTVCIDLHSKPTDTDRRITTHTHTHSYNDTNLDMTQPTGHVTCQDALINPL